MFILILLYLSIVASLIWGRFFFFKLDAGTPGLAAITYDLAVAVQVVATLYYMLTVTQITLIILVLASLVYASALFLFWWSIRTARSLDFAFSESVGTIVTKGPFSLVRHPFYTSYCMVWICSSFIFNSPVLWITLVYLVTFYVLSARKEEAVILHSDQAEQYKNYQKQVGMFLPRIMKWKRSNTEP